MQSVILRRVQSVILTWWTVCIATGHSAHNLRDAHLGVLQGHARPARRRREASGESSGRRVDVALVRALWRLSQRFLRGSNMVVDGGLRFDVVWLRGFGD